MQILELPQETNFCSRVICIECKLDDEPCIIYKPLLSVMGVCLAIHYGFGPCFSCSSGTVQQSCKGSIRFILGSVPCLPFPNLFCCQNVSPHSCYILTCLLFQVCSWWASCSHALWSSSFQCGIWLRWKFNCAICCLLKDRKYLLIHTTGGSWVSLSTTPNNFRTLTFFFFSPVVTYPVTLLWLGFQFQVFIAVLVDNFLYPVSAIRSHFSQSINWSGIRYYLRDGKISKVHAAYSWPKSTCLKIYSKKLHRTKYLLTFRFSWTSQFFKWFCRSRERTVRSTLILEGSIYTARGHTLLTNRCSVTCQEL